MKKIFRIGILILILFGVGISLPVDAKKADPDGEITAIVRARVDIDDSIPPEWLKKPLGLKQILWLALNRNPELKSTLAEAHVSVAEMKQLGLIESPEVEFSTHFPVSAPGFRQDYHVQLTQNLIDLIQRATRKKLGRSQHEGTKWQMASDILQILTGVKKATYRYQAALQLTSFWKSNLAAAHSAAGLAREQRKAGNISQLDEAQNISLLKMAQLEYKKMRTKRSRRVSFLQSWPCLKLTILLGK